MSAQDSPPPVPPRPGAQEGRRQIESLLRVDHAGELAAVQIYRGQSLVFRDTPRADLSEAFRQKEAEESVHFDRFETLMRERGVRPTVMTPVWRMMAFGLGVGTALLGEKAAHACTEAVESVIEGHYAGQIAAIKDREPELAAELTQFREDEIGHRDEATRLGAAEAPAYPLLSAVIKAGCHLAIRISERV